MTIEKKLLGTTPVSGEVLPEAVSFDGTSDYLSRSSDLTGNSDGKTFTFSCWVYRNNGVFQEGFIFDINGLKFHAYIYSDGVFRITARNSSGAQLLTTTSVKKIPNNTWTSVIMSIDLANTSNRYLAINDVIDTGNSYSHYVNDNIDFTDFPMNVATLNSNPIYMYQGRLSNFFLDYTYRDLSVTANRRLFIDAEGKPADGQNSVYNYSLTELYVGSQDSTPLEVFMSTDGTKFYMAGNTTNSVYQYNLSTAYDVSSASYNSVSFSVASQSTEPKGVTFSVDGTKMYIVEASNGVIYQYALTTGFDLSTASYASKSFDTSSQRGGNEPQDVSISSDGTRLYMIISRHIYEYTLSTAYDVSTATYNSKTYNYSSQTVSGTGMAFGNSGTKLYVLGAVGAPLISIIFEYTLSTAWDVSTASYSNNSFIAAGRTNDNMGLALSSNGEHLYSLGNTGDSVFQYDMSTAYDLSTASGSSPTGSATTPILYLPMTDAATAGSNSGTGGDFTVNGVLATAERGPNQDNCSASTFDGSADYLSRSSISGLSNGKLFTFSVNASQTTSNGQIFTASNGKVSIKIESNRVTTRLKGSVGVALYFDSPYPANKLSYGQHNSISFSCDLSDTSKRHMFINGVDVTSGITFTNYSNETALLVQTPYAIGAAATAVADLFNGSIGEFYLDTTYIDLATDNPFWDSTANRPNSVRKVIADTGVTPLIAMPLMGNDAGNNLGSGGDFTVNSGPYVGARGGSEYWARSAKMPTSAYLNRSLTATTRQFSVALAYKTPNINTTARLQFGADTIFLDIQNNMEIRVQAGGSTIANINCSTSNISNDTWYTLLICYDSDNSSKNKVYVNGVSSISSQTNISAGDVVLNGTAYFPQQAAANAEMSGLYFTTDYIDFNQEVNRNKFIDQLGYLIDLTPAIEAGDISNPLIYTKFEDTAALGTNSGTAGNLGVSGTVTAGSDFSI